MPDHDTTRPRKTHFMSEFDYALLQQQWLSAPTQYHAQLKKLLMTMSQRHRQQQPFAREWERWQQQIARANLTLQQRQAALPKLDYDERLPIVQAREEILAAIRDHQVVVIAGETGSGKTTQLPKLCLELGRGVRGIIGHTQPRRLAATSVARRIADELKSTLGKHVGYAIRFDQNISDDSFIAVMTDGVLLQALRTDPLLLRYDTLIIDEAHERSLNIDLLLGYIKTILPKRPDLKVIITSATIDPERFARFFDNAPILTVSGRTYPVDIWYRPVDDEQDDSSLPARIHAALDELWTQGPGDVLVFLSGEGEIREVATYLRRQHVKADVLPLYARLPMAEQNKVFQSGGKTRVVLATNVAETSLTVPGIRYVIDSGVARISRYSQGSRVQRLPIEAISQASANQRSGRCGRVMDGTCIRLYGEDDFAKRDEFTTPEILRTSLADLILQMLALGLTDIESFPFVDAPDTKRISDGLRYLLELGAITEERKLTTIGRRMSQLPLPPALARVVLAGETERCLHEAIIIASFLALRDPRERPQEKADVATGLHRRFHDPDSDFVGVLNLWKHIHERKEALSVNAWRKELKAEFLNVVAIIEWGRLVAQLRASAQQLQLKFNEITPDYRSLHRAVLSGLFHQIGQATRDGDYSGPRNIRFVAHPSSGLHKKAKPWVVVSEFLDGNKLYGLLLAKIEPEWLEQLCGPLLKRHYEEPVWREQRGDAVVHEQATLFGLKVIVRRPIALSRIDMVQARQLFVRHALIRNEIEWDFSIHKQNQMLLKKVQEQEERTRRRDLLRGEDELVALLVARLSQDVFDKHSLLKLYKRSPDALKPLLLTEADVKATLDRISDDDYPPEFVINTLKLPLLYRFAPGEVFDGVTVRVPLSLLHQLPDHVFDALVPGFLPNKLEAILRGLPKETRKELMPIAETAKLLLTANWKQKPFWQALSDDLYSLKRVRVPVAELAAVELPDNLRMYIEVRDGKDTVARGRDLSRLKSELLKKREQSLQNQTKDFQQTHLMALPVQAIAEKVNAGVGEAWLAVQDDVTSVSIVPILYEADAKRLHQQGIIRLLALALQTDFKQYQRNNRALNSLMLAAGAFPCGKQLLDEWLCAAIISCTNTDLWRIRDQTALQALLQTLPNPVRAKLADSLPVLVDLFQLAATLRARIVREFKAKLPDVAADMNAWLDDILAPGFLHHRGLADLRHTRRYLDALRLRIDQCQGNPARELQRMPQWQAWQLKVNAAKVPASVMQTGEWQELQRLLREWRVAVFAQSIGTDGPVSEKRLDQQLARVIELAKGKRQ